MIKTKIIKTDKAEILVIGGIPEDAVIGIIAHGGMIYRTPDASGYDVNRHVVDLPRGKWEQLGFFDNITDDVAKGLVDSYLQEIGWRSDGKHTGNNLLLYRNYKVEVPVPVSMCYNSATESLHSLIEANVKLKNRLIKPWDGDGILRSNEGYQKAMKIWGSEQEKVFTNPFLLKKL